MSDSSGCSVLVSQVILLVDILKYCWSVYWHYGSHTHPFELWLYMANSILSKTFAFKSFVFSLQTSFWVWKKNESKNHFGSEKILVWKKIKVQIKFGFERILVGKNFGSGKIFVQKKFWAWKKIVGLKKFRAWKSFGSKESCVQKFFLIQ